MNGDQWKLIGSFVVGVSAILAGGGAVWAAAEAHWVGERQQSINATSSATIKEPADGRNGGCASISYEGTTLRGTAKLLHGEQLWVLTLATGEGKFYTSQDHVAVGPDGSWNRKVDQIGIPGAKGKGGRFQLVVLRANLNAANYFVVSTQKKKANGYDRLPPGAVSLDQVCVERTS
ncbi:hypothetical protein [Actinocorallia longicatena]|uniref:Uncharacterized protein n=1 Tax=Actinocorallia longicatena TaxID=111803 RepID=A0ABP6QJR7_9ACTN